MDDEVGREDRVVIHARAFLVGFAGLSSMLQDLWDAHDALAALRGGAESISFKPLLETGHDVMRLVIHACQRIADPCLAALEHGEHDPQLRMAVVGSMSVLSDLLERLSVRIELPITQWVTEIAIANVRREDWPAVWRASVWTGAMMHYAEDAAVVLQALLQFLGMGQILETRRAGGEWLNAYGALAALDEYRRTTPRERRAREDAVSDVCVQAVAALAQASRMRAERAVAVADTVQALQFLDSKDLVHLGIHSQVAQPGGVFLSHRGQDAKRPLMDFHKAPRPQVFLDVWARPQGDTNRRFLWRNLAASGEMHAFVTGNYSASDFCMKEVEAWGLLSLARGHSASDTAGRVFLIDGAEIGPVRGQVSAWTRHRSEHSTLQRAIKASAAVLDECGLLGTRSIHGEGERLASDQFNQALLRSNLLEGADLPVIELSREPIESLFALIRSGLSLLAHEADLSQAVADIGAALPDGLPGSGPALVAMLREIVGRLHHALDSHRSIEPVVRCVLFTLAATTEMSAHVVSRWDGHSPGEEGRALFKFVKFGEIIDSVADQIVSWCIALASAGVTALRDEEVLAGLLLGLLPIDHEAVRSGVRVNADFELKPAPSLPEAFEETGLARRVVQVICTSAPALWQRVAVIAALSSFTTRSFLFVDIEGSGALQASVGALAMEDFPHVTLARIEDLPEP